MWLREDGEDDLEGIGSLVLKQEEKATLAAIFALVIFSLLFFQSLVSLCLPIISWLSHIWHKVLDNGMYQRH